MCLDDLVPPSPAAAKQTTRHDTKGDCRKMRAITDIHTWLLAWNLLMMELSRMFPDRVSEFISYQDRIVTAGQRCQVEAWYNYDKAFRAQLADEPWRRWDIVDQNLWTFWFTGQALPFCSACSKYGHTSQSCSFRSFRAKTSDGRKICWRFNHARCNDPAKCKFAHVCNSCKGLHTARQCPSHSQAARGRGPPS